MTINADKLQVFLGRFIADLGATVAAGNVVIGHRLGRAEKTGVETTDGQPPPLPADSEAPAHENY
jgi:hypothetical protein